MNVETNHLYVQVEVPGVPNLWLGLDGQPVLFLPGPALPFLDDDAFGHRSLGSPELGQPLYQDPSGTWGLGGSGIVALTPALPLGAGLALVAATDGIGVFGDRVGELDARALYSFNPALSFQLVASALVPDERASRLGRWWGRARFAF